MTTEMNWIFIACCWSLIISNIARTMNQIEICVSILNMCSEAEELLLYEMEIGFLHSQHDYFLALSNEMTCSIQCDCEIVIVMNYFVFDGWIIRLFECVVFLILFIFLSQMNCGFSSIENMNIQCLKSCRFRIQF